MRYFRTQRLVLFPLFSVLSCSFGDASSSVGDTSGSSTAPRITTQPANQTVLIGQTATFSVVAAGTTPLSYQWRKGGVVISGATLASYTTPPTTADDSGGSFSVVITNSAGNVVSDVAILTVRAAPPAGTWSPISVMADTDNEADIYTWLDTSQGTRTAVLARNTSVRGGVLRELRYPLADGTLRVVSGTDANGWNGHGYIVHHTSGGTPYGAGATGTYRTAFAGAHHAIHELAFYYDVGDISVMATIQWFFATGQDHPIFAVTFASDSLANVDIDTRAPYGDMAFDGQGSNADVSGLGWGDKYKFTTTGAGPVTMDSSWSYDELNVVPYVREWVTVPDSEEGLVQTQSWEHHRTGGTWFYDNWGHTSANKVDTGNEFYWEEDLSQHVMPTSWNWPYQLNQYELPSIQSSKRMAWGLMYGAVGKNGVTDYGGVTTSDGYPFRSYSVYEVYGIASDSAVMAQVTQVEHKLAARLQATAGQLVTSGPGGVGRTDNVTYAQPGYNQIYGAFEMNADPTGVFAISIDPAGGAITNPIFIVRGASGLPASVTLDGAALTADEGYFASYDSSTLTLWLTINTLLSANCAIAGET